MPRAYSAILNAKGRSKKHSFIMLRHDIYDSAAWKDLSCVERSVWLEVMRRYNGINNGNIPMSCREVAAALKISKDTASKALNTLVDRGFLRITQHSYFNLKTKRSRRWRLTHEACDPIYDEQAPTNEWRKYK